MITFLYIIIGFFGLVIGSFLNAVIYRLYSGESILKGRSHCVSCSHILKWYDLFPVFSYVFLRGKCRYCKKPISFQYPLVEVVTGLITILIFTYQFTIFNKFSIVQFSNSIFLLFIISGLIIIFVYDLKHYIIPDKVLLPIISTIFLWKFLSFNNWELLENWLLKIENFESLLGGITIGILLAFPFAALYFISKGQLMGFGDIKLAFFIGLFLGLIKGLVALFISFLSGAIIGVTLIIMQKKDLKSKVPFAPFLIFGTLTALFFGDWITEKYISIMF